MDLGLNLRVKGRVAKPVAAAVERDLTEKDLEELGVERGTKSPEIQRLRQRHHALAKALVKGYTHSEAAVMTGYSVSRVSILLADPSFKELMAFYASESEKAFIDTSERLANITNDALDMLQERMEEAPDDISVGHLLAIAQLGADRTGHGPSQKIEHNHKIGLADKLALARERSEKHRLSRPRDITPPEEQ